MLSPLEVSGRFQIHLCIPACVISSEFTDEVLIGMKFLLAQFFLIWYKYYLDQLDGEGAGTSNFLTYFCGSKQHPCSSDVDFDSR